MEVQGSHDKWAWVLIFEAFGAACLLYAINMSLYGAIGCSFCLLIAVIVAGPISGAHFNPAVTLGVFIKLGEFKNTGKMLMIWLAQIVGAYLGIFLAWLSLMYGGT